MSNRRILSLWFPRLGAERWLRAAPHLRDTPFATVAQEAGGDRIAALSLAASQAGLTVGQPLRDAHAVCGGLITRAADPMREAAFLNALHRWAGRFSPWVAAHPPDALVIDLTGCAHLFGGEAALCDQVTRDCADLGLTLRIGLADTLGTAWALARYAGAAPEHSRTGDAIDQEAHATRAKAGKRRHWERGGTAPTVAAGPSGQPRISPPGHAWSALSPLPVAALRLPDHTIDALNRLGLRRVGDILGQPRAALARRFGRGLVDRLDQALGAAPEPISPAAAPDRFSARLSFPDPIGLAGDVEAGLARLLDTLCAKLKERGQGARVLRLEAHLCDGTMQWHRVVSARASHETLRLLDLLKVKIAQIDAGPGIDMLRLEAQVTEALHARTQAGHAEAAALGARRRDQGAALEDLVGRLGARLGMEAITRRHPGDSHIPEKSARTLAAAWSEPCTDWPATDRQRPLELWPPELVQAPDHPDPPVRFRWRGRDWQACGVTGPERIAPEWWFDDPAWRSGPRDYWRIVTDRGDRLWLFYAHGGALSSGWFCHGSFA